MIGRARRWALVVVASCLPVTKMTPPSSEVIVELVESAPVETSLDHPDVANADVVWTSMIRGATKSIDLAEFYVSDSPGSRLHEVVGELERASDRGVVIRLLVDSSFYEKYPHTVDALGKRPGIFVRRYDLKARMGGVLHAKYFVVDGREAYVGSQNFDWRSLEHIQELGVRLRGAALAGPLGALFLADWEVAAGAPISRFSGVWSGLPRSGDDRERVTLAASPSGYLPTESAWDLPILISWIDSARSSLDVQLLTYKPSLRDGSRWPDLDDALRRAVARQVRVRLTISSWGAKEASLRGLVAAGCEVRVMTIPQWSGGEVPFARVAHAKFAIFDGSRAWIGTSNWEGDYFAKSRNVSVFIEGGAVPSRAQALFNEDFLGQYAAPLPGPS